MTQCLYIKDVCFVSQSTGVCHKRGKQQCLLQWITGSWSATLLILRTFTGRFPWEVSVIGASSDRSPGTQPYYAKYFWWTVTSTDISEMCISGIWKMNSKKSKECYKSLGMPTKTPTWKQTAPYMQEQSKNALIDNTKNNCLSLHLFFNPCFYQRSFISHTERCISKHHSLSSSFQKNQGTNQRRLNSVAYISPSSLQPSLDN